MYLSAEKTELVFRKIKHIKEHMQRYCIAPDRAKLSIEDLQWCICDMYGLKVTKLEVFFEGEFLRGMVERYADDRARILLRANQSDVWMRFTSAKELCHLAIDEEEDWSSAGTKTLDSMLYEVRLDREEEENGGGDEERATAVIEVQSEHLAEIAAVELMYPMEYREADKASVLEKRTTLRAIAAHFHVPEYAVGLALHPDYMVLAQRGWAAVSR